MLITIELLRKHNACEQGIKFLERFYPNGAEMIELIQDKNVPKEMLHWGRKHLTHSSEELEAYEKACNIKNTEGHWYSQDLSDSKYIIKSREISGSVGVIDSMDIRDSVDVVGSESVLNSSQILYSSMIDESSKVFKSQNITNSTNICNSTMIADSKSVIDSFSVFDSSEIIGCSNAFESYFCKDSKGIKHCMFCQDIKDAEYCIFNKPIDKKYFELIEKQYLKYLTELLDFIRDWPKDLIVRSRETPTRKFDDWYHSISPRFWKWARTLPNFDAMLLYNITMLPQILLD